MIEISETAQQYFKRLIKQQDDRECSFFMDARHLNNKGKQVFTQALLPELEKFWRHLTVNKGG